MGQIQINNRPYDVHQPMKNVKALLTADQFHLIPLFRFFFFHGVKRKTWRQDVFQNSDVKLHINQLL